MEKVWTVKVFWEALKAALKGTWKPTSFIMVILLPVIYPICMVLIAHVASHLGLFYMRHELTTLITVALIPVVLTYLLMKLIKPAIVKRFGCIIAVILFALVSVSTTMESMSVAPLVKADNAFIAPEGWSKSEKEIQPGRGLLQCFDMWGTETCPEVKSVWVKTDYEKITSEDIQNVLTTNGYTNSDYEGQCGKNQLPSDCDYSGKVKGAHIMVRTSGADLTLVIRSGSSLP